MEQLIVYTLDASTATELDIDGHKIEAWVDYEIRNNRLTDEAEMFIKMCYEKGTIYSLKSFVESINLNEINTDNMWVYITNKQ